jgi:thermostable 8-oxoguanine DNA glycosylase
MKRKATAQLEFTSVLDSSFRTHERKFVAFMAEHVTAYRVNADQRRPDLTSRHDIYTRIAFAILSANAPFADAVEALGYCAEHKGMADAKVLAQWKMVPAKARYVNQLWDYLQQGLFEVVKKPIETWSQYRYRLQKTFKGLGIAKASFAVSLLYPLEADVACIDTWMQKVFLGHTGFKSLSKRDYETVEARIRTYALRFRCSTFLAQWMIWDHARGGTFNAHDIFPGSHK